MKTIFKEYINVALQVRWAFLLVMIGIVSATFLGIYVPVFYKNIANGFAEPFSVETSAMMLHNFWMIVLFYAGIWLSWRVLEIGIVPVDGGGMRLLNKRCFKVLKRQKFLYFENNFSGSLIKQAGRFSRSYEVIVDWFIFQFVQNVLSISIAFIIFYQHYPEFAYYFLVWVIGFIIWSVGFSIWKLKYDKAVAESDSKLGGAYSDAISNIFIVKSFALEKSEQNNIDEKADVVYQKTKIAWILMFVSFAVQGFLTMGIELVLVYKMIGKWELGLFNVGEFVLFQSILLILVQRLWEFGRNFRNFFTALADAAEMADVFKNDDFERDSATAKDLKISNGGIQIKNINFAYSSSDKSQDGLFEDFSLDIKPGEKIALVGHSGSGKTSLTKLLFRFFEPQQGKILFDGQDAKDFTLSSLRNQISLVPQQPELFHRTVRENILLGEEVSEEALIKAAKNSGCLDFIQSLPEQFETMVGERGVKLSGGEKQRIALARAFLEDAPIVVLDEATSALDSITEKQIQSAIFELIEEKTAIVIAHRLSTILRMDRILVLDSGKIIEQGTHQELLDKGGKYATMWKHQSGEFLKQN
ncbi:ABC transporter ATP-binding protein [Cocleimonas sp. KMM 6892]|uniref:ABC transporter ATP-binding protein n=1 Tax=unclassified Cocleimonas TaxID=2639732 RepID=UPI002DBE8BD8|nr:MULTISPECIES: ABC transporter ATP-binding protein [unclassified Cocleimonas]MEB8431484.1 ABC transporter ATP-binding protein [Cocleimonas sp. KMM 6892]MEC4713744.1 ABC transporter ATP-binding protein [Cocleimonas sp. KMM 6895]MEC4743075.1 ABC transporter ATP-binding protein [Cocleimonas sp. KMM 6896]